MTLQPQQEFSIPEETARVARAAYPKGNVYIKMRDALGTFYQDKSFAHFFPPNGRPTLAENALLRKPLIILRRQVKRPACTWTDQMLLVLLARMVRSWKQAHITRSTRDEARGGIASSFACIGSASPRLLLVSPRSPKKPSP